MATIKSLNPFSEAHISGILDSFFDQTADDLLSPEFKKVKYGRSFIFSSFPESSLPSVFKLAIGGKESLSHTENELLTKVLKNVDNYIDSLRAKTKANMISEIDAYLSESSLKSVIPKKEVIESVVIKNLDKAKTHLATISEAEATRIRNLGRVVSIAKSSASIGVEDPDVYIVRDGATCHYCIHNHLMPDKVTPRVFKLSEVKMSFLSKEDKEQGEVSCYGQHPSCRCSLNQLPRYFGFKKGKLSYTGDEPVA